MTITRRGFLHSLSGIGLMIAGVSKATAGDSSGFANASLSKHKEGVPGDCGTCLRVRKKYLQNPTAKNRHALDQSVDYHVDED